MWVDSEGSIHLPLPDVSGAVGVQHLSLSFLLSVHEGANVGAQVVHQFSLAVPAIRWRRNQNMFDRDKNNERERTGTFPFAGVLGLIRPLPCALHRDHILITKGSVYE